MSFPARGIFTLTEAANLLRVSEDCLLRKARAGKVPGAKIGRRWVFVRADLIELIRHQARERTDRRAVYVERTCRFIDKLRAPTGGSDSRSAESKLDAALARLTA
jgi:excisionase family DNA binding protein